MSPSPVILVNDGSPFQDTTGTATNQGASVLVDIAPVDIYLPALFVWHTGSLLRFTGSGIITTAAAPPGLTMGLYIGSNTAIGSNTSMCTSASISPLTASLSNNTWQVEFTMRVTALGASGTAVSSGTLMLPTSATLGTTNTYVLPGAGSATGNSQTFINSQANYVQLGALFGKVSGVTDSIQCYQWFMEALDT